MTELQSTNHEHDFCQDTYQEFSMPELQSELDKHTALLEEASESNEYHLSYDKLEVEGLEAGLESLRLKNSLALKSAVEHEKQMVENIETKCRANSLADGKRSMELNSLRRFVAALSSMRAQHPAVQQHPVIFKIEPGCDVANLTTDGKHQREKVQQLRQRFQNGKVDAMPVLPLSSPHGASGNVALSSTPDDSGFNHAAPKVTLKSGSRHSPPPIQWGRAPKEPVLPSLGGKSKRNTAEHGVEEEPEQKKMRREQESIEKELASLGGSIVSGERTRYGVKRLNMSSSGEVTERTMGQSRQDEINACGRLGRRDGFKPSESGRNSHHI
jgi:hypothetical protein